MSDDCVTLIIPTHNEEKVIIDRVLTSLKNQNYNNLVIDCIIIPNGCTDKTTFNVQEFVSNVKIKNINWRVEELTEGHRTKAINYGISLSHTEIVMYLNPDCFLEPNAVVSMYDLIASLDNLNYVSMFGEPDLSFVPADTLLYKTLQLISYNKRVSNILLPEGRFVAFRKMIFPKFPEIHSEDTWASLYSYNKYGPDSIKVLMNPILKYIPYTNWIDFMKVESRYLEGTQEVYEKFSGFREINSKRIADNKISDEKRLGLIAEFCNNNNIDFKFALNFKDVIFPLVRENAQLVKQIDKAGTWQLV